MRMAWRTASRMVSSPYHSGGSQPAPGIYSLEGDTFKWCSAGGSNKVRPTSFASTSGSKQSLMVLRREKK